MAKREPQPPKEGVTPELFELVSKWLRTTYGSRPLDHMRIYCLEHNLGDLERAWCKERPPEQKPDALQTTALRRM